MLDILGILNLPNQSEGALDELRAFWQSRRNSFIASRDARLERLKGIAANIQARKGTETAPFQPPQAPSPSPTTFSRPEEARRPSEPGQFNFQSIIDRFRNTAAAPAQTTGGSRLQELFSDRDK